MPRIKDLHLLPKFKDSLSYLYVEHCSVEQEKLAIAVIDKEGKVPVPCAGLALLMLGPGTKITHAAITTIADNGCLVVWCGEEGIRFYAQAMGKTRSARNVIKQAKLVSDPVLRQAIAVRMYVKRFKNIETNVKSIQQLRGMEGARVRKAYQEASQKYSVPWSNRAYKRDEWAAADPVNKALSTANSCLYGLCHAAIVSIGYSPALGFIHVGKQLSFVYDIGDLYKTEITIPIAFSQARDASPGLERRVRLACRDAFKDQQLLSKVVPDIEELLSSDGLNVQEDDKFEDALVETMLDEDDAMPGGLWDPDDGTVTGGKNFGVEEDS